MKFIAMIVCWILTLVLGGVAQAPARFDMVVRSDFFAGFAGDEARLNKAMAVCEQALADNPKHAEALVWHGAGLFFQSGVAFRRGDTQTGMDLFGRGIKEMDDAVALAPESVGVLIPRGAVLLTGSHFMPPEQGTPLLKTGLSDYEKTLALQTASGVFSTLGDHPKGELLFGLAEGFSRLGDSDKARTYFEQLIKVAPASGHAPQAQEFLSTGTLPQQQGLGCVGCHK